MVLRILTMKILFLAFVVCFPDISFAEETQRERTTCKGEAFTFWLWSFLAGATNPDEVLSIPNTELITFLTNDRRTLKGFRLKSDHMPAKGYVLVIQGNAWLASQLAPYLIPLRNIGLDVYIYDFRGYGLSKPGFRRFAAIIEDYQEIIDELNASYEYKFIYSFSFGGVVLLNALNDYSSFDLVVIDSSPSTLNEFNCKENYSPVDKLPNNCSNFYFISGTKDNVIKQKKMSKLLEKGQECGALQDINKPRGHPFQDESNDIRRKRVYELSVLFQEKMK